MPIEFGIRSYSRKTIEKSRIVCALLDADFTRWRIHYYSPMKHLYEPYSQTDLKLRGSGAPEPKIMKIEGRSGPLRQKSVISEAPRKSLILHDLDVARFLDPGYGEI